MWIKGGFIQQPNGARRLISHRTQLIISLRNVGLNGHTSRPRPLGLSPKALVAAQPPHSARGGPLWQREKSLFLCAREMETERPNRTTEQSCCENIQRKKGFVYIRTLFYKACIDGCICILFALYISPRNKKREDERTL